jgi:membrane-bound ClpP family serine protease
MAHALAPHRIFALALGFFEHAAAIVAGLVLMVVGLALGVTMIMLPVGMVIGLIGVALVIGGLFARIDRS